jgi:hypothetical protein
VIAAATPRARRQQRFLVPTGATFGAENTFSLVNDIVINEIMYEFPPTPGSPAVEAVTSTAVILPLNTTWRYNRSNSDLGNAWAQTAHPLGSNGWLSGPALLGFETAALPETLRTPFLNANAPTYYFETDFTLTPAQAAGITHLRLEHIIDDGAAFYINGFEVAAARTNLNAGFNFASLAPVGIDNATLSVPVTFPVTGLNLQAGTNRISVEVHQVGVSSSDMVFGARLSSVTTLSPAVPAIPVTSNPEEWIELYNKGTVAASLGGWKLDGSVGYNFPISASLAAGDYLIVAKNAAALRAKWPEMTAKIFGDFSGSLPNSGGRIQLEDPFGNPADEVTYFPTEYASGGGSSLELRDGRSDNNHPPAWADSNETSKSAWQTVTYRMTPSQLFGLSLWNEFRLGMLDAGECLIDDLSVRADPNGAATQIIQNGNFETLPTGSKWRLLGNHRLSAVIPEPGNPANHVLRLSATGPTETNHNHAESTFVGNTPLNTNLTYEVSFRARWLAGTNQLNTRAYFQRLARTTELSIPARLGTPGAANSRVIANVGPALTGLTHAPVTPPVNAPAIVSVDAADPDGVASATLRYRVNGTVTFTSVPMSLSNGKWSAPIPAQTTQGTIVHFYVEAADSLGAVTFGPARGSDSRALIQWADAQGTTLPTHVLRLIMLTSDRDTLLNSFNRTSNERLPSTFVYRDSEIFYDTGVRLQGSAIGRPSFAGYDIGFSPTQLFRGVHANINIDRSGNYPVLRGQHEIFVKHCFNRAGIPCTADDLCYFIAPRTTDTSMAILQMASYGSDWVDGQYSEPGTVFNMDGTYEPNSVSPAGNPENPKPPDPLTQVYPDLTDYGNDKEQYRSPFDIRSDKRRDDYRSLIKACQTMDLPTAKQLALEAPKVLDLDEMLRCTALYNLWGIADGYLNAGGLKNNLRLFCPDSGIGVQFLPWDMDFIVYNGATSPLMPSSAEDHNWGRIINDVPANKRLFLGHVRHLCATVFTTAYMTPWLNHLGAVSGQNFTTAVLPSTTTTIPAYITNRAAYAATQYPPVVAYNITTNGGADFSVAANDVAIEGTGWIDIRTIRRAGSLLPIDITWPTIGTWRATLPIVSGANTISLDAYDFDGLLIGTRTITVTNTLAAPSAQDFLRITEFHYHPANPTTPADLAVSATDTDFEFIELKTSVANPLASMASRLLLESPMTCLMAWP